MAFSSSKLGGNGRFFPNQLSLGPSTLKPSYKIKKNRFIPFNDLNITNVHLLNNWHRKVGII